MTAAPDPTSAAGDSLLTRWGAAGYLVLLLGTEVLTMLVGMALWAPDGRQAQAQLAVYLAGVLLAVWAFLVLPRRVPARGLLRWFLVLALALWVIDAGRRMFSGAALNPLWFTVVLLIVFVWLKPPDRADASRVVTSMAVLLAGTVIVAVALEALGLSASWYVREEFLDYLAFDKVGYWLPLAGPLGLDARWAGPFPHPNMAGPVGGFLIVVGMSRRGWVQGVSLATGVAVLLLTASRTAAVGAFAGALVVAGATFVWSRPRGWWQRGVLIGTPVVVLGVLLAGVRLANTQATTEEVVAQVAAATGRTEIWPTYYRMWLESPWFGSPDLRIHLAAQRGEIPDWASTAHNLLLDTLLRYGVFGAALMVAALVVAGLMGIRASAQGVTAGLGMVAVTLGCALTEALLVWRLFAISTILIFLAVLASAGDYPPVRTLRSRAPTTPVDRAVGDRPGGAGRSPTARSTNQERG